MESVPELGANGLDQADGGGRLALAQRGRSDARHHDIFSVLSEFISKSAIIGSVTSL